MNKNKKGKLIVLDGGDGSGKTTQAKLLVVRLKKRGISVKFFSFPRYEESFFGELVARYLRGELGKIDQVSPYLIALAYADDRAQTRVEMEELLAKGGVVLCDRYTTSSQAHLSANLPEAKREEFISWIDELEYNQHKMPRPDKVIYLYVPWQVGRKITIQGANSRAYSKTEDIHEKSNHHRIEAEKMYLKFVSEHRNWNLIDCIENGKLLPIDDIARKLDKLINLVV